MPALRAVFVLIPVAYALQGFACAGEPSSEASPASQNIWRGTLAPPSVWSQLNARRSRDVERLLLILERLPPTSSAAEPGSDDVPGVSELLALDADDEGEIVDAMYSLGEIRAAKAAGPLAERLTFLTIAGNFTFTEPVPTVNHFPAAFALIRIGEPAIRELLKVIEDDDSTEFERRLAVLTLMHVEMTWGYEVEESAAEEALAKERLLLRFQQRTRQASPAVKERYDRTIEWLKDYEEQHKDPRTIPGFLPDATTADAPSE